MKKPVTITLRIEEVINDNYIIPKHLLQSTINHFILYKINGKIVKKKYEKS